MLYAKFQGNQPLCSEEGDFLSFFSINGPGSYLGHVTWNISTNFHSLHMKFGFNSLVFFEES